MLRVPVPVPVPLLLSPLSSCVYVYVCMYICIYVYVYVYVYVYKEAPATDSEARSQSVWEMRRDKNAQMSGRSDQGTTDCLPASSGPSNAKGGNAVEALSLYTSPGRNREKKHPPRPRADALSTRGGGRRAARMQSARAGG